MNLEIDSLNGISVTAVSDPQEVFTLDGDKLTIGGKKEVSGWASVVGPGIIPESLIGATVIIKAKLVVVSTEPVLDGSEMCSCLLSFVGNSSDFAVKIFGSNDSFSAGIDDILSEHGEDDLTVEGEKTSHRFTGFMDNEE